MTYGEKEVLVNITCYKDRAGKPRLSEAKIYRLRRG